MKKRVTLMFGHASYTTLTVESWAKAKEIFTALGPDCIFRGQGDCAWEISSSFERGVLSRLSPEFTPEGRLEIERLHLRSFKRGAHLYQIAGRQPTDILSWWAEMQHYGMGTRLVDFTWSPYVASFFAFEDASKKCDRAIWALDDRFVGRQVVDNLVKEFGTEENNQSIYNTEIWNSDSFVEMFLWEAQRRSLRMISFCTPDRMNERMLTQQGLFVMPSTIDIGFMENIVTFLGTNLPRALIKITIPNAFRVEILTDLKLMNITRASLFPGLDGYALFQQERSVLGLDAEKAGLNMQRRNMRASLGLPN